MEQTYLYLLLSYLIGSMPTGFVIGRFSGVDIRQQGSTNIGATNVSRILGKKLGLITLIGDAIKAVVPMALAGRLLTGEPQLEMWVMLCGAAAFLGHLYPIYLKFKGGKGVATALGVFLYLNPLAALIALLFFIGIVANWRYVSAGSMAASALMPPLLWIMGAGQYKVLLALTIGVLIWLKHWTNIKRLLRGEETKWGGTAKNNGEPGQPIE